AHHSEWPGAPDIGMVTSNGLACGVTYKEAALPGMFETGERAAHMLTWYSKPSLPKIDINASDRLRNCYNNYTRPTFLDSHLLDMTISSGIPTVLAVIKNSQTDLAPFAIGAASAYSIERACEKAATEGMYTRTWAKTEQREGNALTEVDYDKD